MGSAERAPAKVNLSLQIVGRRPDGYHLLESLVVFADVADELTLAPGPELGLSVSGAFVAEAGPTDDNLVLGAARALARRVPGLRLGRFTLDKRIPVAAGLGGGSADAAAALRLLARENDLSAADPRVIAAALETGADVPVCLDPRPALMRGIGETITRLDLPALDGVLVNPRIAVPTAAVFRELGLAAGETRAASPHPDLSGVAEAAALLRLLQGARNDLEPAACRIAPEIVAVLAALRAAGARLVRMSGSGATVVGLTRDGAAAGEIARDISLRHPAWWARPVKLGPGLDAPR